MDKIRPDVSSRSTVDIPMQITTQRIRIEAPGGQNKTQIAKNLSEGTADNTKPEQHRPG